MKITKNTRPFDFTNHPRCRTSYVVRNGSDGVPEVVATILEVPPTSGGGAPWVALVDHQHPDGPKSYTGSASGFGYDKFKAVVDGMTVGGHVIDMGPNTISNICYRNKWLFLEA